MSTPKKLKNLQVTRVALVDAGANPEADILIYKAAGMNHQFQDDGSGRCAECGMTESEHMAKAAEPPTHKEAASVADELQKNLDEVTAERDALKAELDALAEMSNDDLAALKGFAIAKTEEDEINKADLPESVRKALEEGEALRVRVEKMEADNRRADFVRKAEAEYGDLAPAAEFGPVLEEIDRKAPEAAKALDQMLKAVAARAETSALFAEAGGDKPAGDDLFAVVKSRAAEIAKEEGIGETEALQKAMAENADKAHEALSK